jgi:hypothetical protein
MRVRPRGTVREAWQYQAGHKRPPWVMRYTEFVDGEMILKRHSGKQRIEYSEWLVWNLDGDPIWFTNDEFQRMYEEA